MYSTQRFYKESRYITNFPFTLGDLRTLGLIRNPLFRVNVIRIFPIRAFFYPKEQHKNELYNKY